MEANGEQSLQNGQRRQAPDSNEKGDDGRWAVPRENSGVPRENSGNLRGGREADVHASRFTRASPRTSANTTDLGFERVASSGMPSPSKQPPNPSKQLYDTPPMQPSVRRDESAGLGLDDSFSKTSSASKDSGRNRATPKIGYATPGTPTTPVDPTFSPNIFRMQPEPGLLKMSREPSSALPSNRESSGLFSNRVFDKNSPGMSPLQKRKSMPAGSKDSKASLASFVLGAITSYLRSRLMTILGDELTAQIDALLAREQTVQQVKSFSKAGGQPQLLFFYQKKIVSTAPVLFLPDLAVDPLEGRCIYFVRTVVGDINPDHFESDVSIGEFSPPLFEAIDHILSELHGSILHSRQYNWNGLNDDSIRGCLSTMDQLNNQVQQTVNSMYAGMQLKGLDQWLLDDDRAKNETWNKLALDDNSFMYLSSVLEEWCSQVEQLLQENDIIELTSAETGNEHVSLTLLGPRTEVAWWKKRAAKLGSVVDQLKGKQAKIVLSVTGAGKAKAMKRWKEKEEKLNEVYADAKVNVRLLTDVDKTLEPFYSGTASQIQNVLPDFFSKFRILARETRHYKSRRRIERFLSKTANQLVSACKRILQNRGKLLEQEPGDATESVKQSLSLCQMFRELVTGSKERMMTSSNSKAYVFSTELIFANILVFEERLAKVSSMLQTVQQFVTLENAGIEELEIMFTAFQQAVGFLKTQPYDLLDFVETGKAFDKDFAEFTGKITVIEVSMSDFISRTFEEVQNIELALDLLEKLAVILQRDSLKGDLEDKYTLIFQHYGDQLERVQTVYESQKANPPLFRNLPPVSGSILWARHLLTKIEEPMQRFQSNHVILAATESKKIIRLFNRVARTLIEYETLWYQAWCDSVEATKSGLQATLLVRNPENPKQYCVNFDPEVMQLIREAKVLSRIGLPLPATAQNILEHEGRFKTYRDQLESFLSEFNELDSTTPSRFKAMLVSHVTDLDRLVRPGILTLTWESMNIDGYVHQINASLSNLQGLVGQVREKMQNTIDNHLIAVRRMSLVHFPAEGQFMLDEFVFMEKEVIASKSRELIELRNQIEEGIDQILEAIQSYTLEFGERVILDPKDVYTLKNTYGDLFYAALLGAVKNSFAAIKKRLTSRTASRFTLIDQPFFDIEILLVVPKIQLQPSLDDVQEAICETALHVLKSIREVPLLGGGAYFQEPISRKTLSYYDRITNEQNIVAVCLMLTGSVDGTRRAMLEYLDTFQKFEFLWRDDKNTAFNAFLKKQPTIHDYEFELARFSELENQIMKIDEVYNLSCMSLRTQSLKYSLKAEVTAWKAQYSKRMHKQAQSQMYELVEYLQTSTQRLSKEVSHVDDVGNTLKWLRDLRTREADLEQQISPIEGMYYVMRHYDVRLPKEETDMLFRLRLMWKELLALGQERSSKLSHLQAGFRREVVRAVKSFSLEVMQFCNDFDMNGPMVAGLAPMEAKDRLNKYLALFGTKRETMKALQERELLFGLVVTEYEDLSRVQSELGLLTLLYNLHSRVESSVSSFSERLWTMIPPSVHMMSKTFTDLQADLHALPRVLREWPAYDDLAHIITDFISVLPVVSNLCHPGIRRRHWMQVVSAAGQQTATFNIDPDTFKLKHLLALKPVNIRVEIDEICRTAKKELEIEAKVQGLGEQWTDRQFQFVDYKNRPGAILDPTSIYEIIKSLDESITDLTAISSTTIAEALSEEVDSWMAKLSAVSEVIESWSVVQTKWTFMETIFSDPNLSEQLPQDAKRFSKVDTNYMKLISRASHNRHVINCCNSDHQLKSLLPHLMEQLEQCERSLASYLQGKRASFPRFYFVSDHVLLDFLTRTTNAAATELQGHLSAIFSGIAGLRIKHHEESELGEDEQEFPLVTHTLAFRGTAIEELPLDSPPDTEGGIDVWLGKVDVQTQATIKSLTQDAISHGHNLVLETMITQYPAQVGVLILHLNWAMESARALKKAPNEANAMVTANKRNSQVIAEMVLILESHDKSKPHQRFSVQNMIIVQMHLRDVFDEIVKKHIINEQDFDYTKSARHEVDKDTRSICIRCAGVEVNYGYDYEGLSQRSVVTPTTDRCTISFLHALAACVCGALVGPADVGKSATVKEISILVGRFVFIVNCHQHLDMAYFEKCFMGLPACGCFGCFDELNRLTYPVLSAIAQQLNQVLASVRERRNMSAFQDILRSPNLTSAQDLRLGLFLTFTNDSTDCRQDMHKLDSMRGLYRTFSMPKLETELIVSVKLAAAGFKEYPKIARKLKTLYECTSVQLSGSKRITALGMRNLMAVLQLASKAKVESEAFFGENKISEMDMVVRAIQTVNIPRMTAVDKGIFSATLGDIFAGVQAPVLAQLQGEPRGLGTQQRQAPTVTEQDLSDAISTLLRKQKMDKHATWMEKTLQLHAIMESNHGIMVLGAAALGKSSIITILQQAQQRLNADTHTYLLNKMNPKSLPVQQMFGWRSASADQWHDGTFSFLLRRAQSQPGITNWIVLDGPIDPIWAENLNTLLDDQKLLTLANGDRIGMKTLSRIIFESDKSDNASPATMARVGVVWVPSTALPWRSFVNKWIEGRGSEERVILRSLFDRYMDQLLHFQKMQCSPVVQTPATYVPWMLTRMFECASKFMDFRWDASGEVFLEKIFIFCLCWSFGGLLENMDRIKLSQFMYTLTDLLPNMKNDVTLFDFYPDDNVLDWEHWRTRIQDWKYPKQFDPTSIFVSTEDTCRTEFILRLLSSQRLNFLMTGATASCKSHNLRQFISSLDTEKHVATTVPLSQASTTHALLDHILNVIHKRQGRTYGPDPGKSCVIVVEDISLTPADKWGDQANCEVLRQLINEGGYYDLQKPTEWTSIMGLHYACVMTHPLSTHRDIPMRLKGQLCAFNLTMPSENSMNAALTKVFDKHFNRSKAPASVIKFAKMLPEATIALCKSLRQALVTNDSKIHYTFNLHDVMRVLTSVLHCRSVEMTTPELVLRLWRHDCERVFGDKLVSVDHRMVVLESIQHILQHKSFDEINRGACLEAQIERFGKFFRDGGSQEQNTAYGVLPDMDTIADNLEELQARKATTNFPLYDEAIEQIVRVARVLCMKRGSVILVGTLNSGRGPIVQLASEVANSICFDPSDLEMRGGGSHMDCLRNAYWIAGIDNKPVTVVLFIDKTKDDSLFDKVNHFLLTGYLPGAIQKKELDTIVDDMRSSLQDGVSTLLSDRQIFATFERRAWNNLHIVACCRPEESAFRTTMQRFPVILSSCQTIWMLPWAGGTLNDVAGIHFSDFSVSLSIEVHELSEYAARVHTLIQEKIDEYTAGQKSQIYITPRTFVAFINAFKSIYETQSKVLEDRLQRIQTALKKLRDAGYQVSEMKSDLLQREGVLQNAIYDTAELLKKISISTMHAERKKVEVLAAKKKISERAHEIQHERSTLELDLESAKPLLLEAQSARALVSREDLLYLGSQKSQTLLVRHVLDLVLIVLRHKVRPIEMQDARSYRDSFIFAIEVLSAPDCYERLQEVECNSMNGETAELLAPYFSLKDFNPQKLNSVSVQAANLAVWIQAMARYYDATSIIIPKMDAVDDQEADLEEEYEALAQQQQEFDERQASLNAMHETFEVVMAQRQQYKIDAEYAKSKLASSTLLLTGLQEERTRWIEETEESREETTRLPGDSGIASAMMVYLGPFDGIARAELLQSLSALCHEMEIGFSHELHVPKFFTTQNEISSWFVQELPCDEFSIQNGMLALYCQRYPLLIDPQEQLLRWIKARENPRIVRDSTSNQVFTSTVADCITNGRVLVYEGIENTIKSELELLFDQTFSVNRRTDGSHGESPTRIFWAGKEIEMHPAFRVFMTCTLPNPHFDADLSGRTTIIDATMSQRGMEDQVLNMVVQIEDPKLKQSRIKLLIELNGLRKEMDDLDKSMLTELSESEGNLLDNDALMKRLTDIKAKLTEVDEKLLAVEESEADILRSYEQYRPVATRGSLLYFAVLDMARLNKMYQVSMAMFDAIVEKAINNTGGPNSPGPAGYEDRISMMTRKVTRAVLKFYPLCYARQHQIVFEICVALRLGLSEQGLNSPSPDYLHCLSKCGSGLEISLVQRKPKDWIPDTVWLNLVCIVDKFGGCRSFIDSMVKREAAWKAWYEKEMPEIEPVPDHENLDPVLKLLLIRAMREDRLIAAARDFFMQVLGEGFSGQSVFDINSVWKWSTPIRPIMLHTASNVDPSDAILAFARKKSVQCKFISIGEGTDLEENSPPQTVVQNAITMGCWVVLQNANLDSPAVVDKLLAAFSELVIEADKQKPAVTSSRWHPSSRHHDSFRIWITARAWGDCPTTLILRSVCAMYQPPISVRETMLKLYNEHVLPDSIRNDKLAARQLYTVSLLYSVMLQRRKYGACGWSSSFDLDITDWITSTQYMTSLTCDSSLLAINSAIIKAGRFMLGEILLGGLIDDRWDKNILKTLLEAIMVESSLSSDRSLDELIPGCRMPEEASYHCFVASIQEIPEPDHSALLGLSINADHLHRVESCQQIIACLSEIVPNVTVPAEGSEMEEVVTEIATNMLAKIPSPWNPEQLKGGKSKANSKTAMHALMLQEVEHMQEILRTVRSTLQNLLLTISGAVPFNEKASKVMNALFDAIVPESWIACSWNVSSLGEWIAGLMQRHEQLSRWIHARPKSIWMTGLFNPAALLIALKQDAFRRNEKHGWCMEQLALAISTGANETKPALHEAKVVSRFSTRTPASEEKHKDADKDLEDSILITGFYLDGASWSPKDHRLVEVGPKSTYSEFPKLTVTVYHEIPEEEAGRQNAQGEKTSQAAMKILPRGLIKDSHGVVYHCPCYSSSIRTSKNHIFDVPIVTENPQAVVKWTLRGVAILSSKY